MNEDNETWWVSYINSRIEWRSTKMDKPSRRYMWSYKHDVKMMSKKWIGENEKKLVMRRIKTTNLPNSQTVFSRDPEESGATLPHYQSHALLKTSLFLKTASTNVHSVVWMLMKPTESRLVHPPRSQRLQIQSQRCACSAQVQMTGISDNAWHMVRSANLS